MKNLITLSLLFICSLSYAQLLIHQEGFEGTNYVGYSTTNSLGTNVTFQNFAASDYFFRGNNSSQTSWNDISNFEGSSFLLWEDFDGYVGGNSEIYITLDALTVTNYTGMKISFDVAAPNTTATRYEPADFLIIEYNIDNAGWVKIGECRGDSPTGGRFRFDDERDGTVTSSNTLIAAAMQTFTADLDVIAGSAVTGNSLVVRVRAFSGIQEEMALDRIRIEAATLLPVELTSFNGNQRGNDVLLNWQTASEQNNKKFMIEKTSNLENFEAIGEVQGSGTTTEREDYSFEDNTPKNGINYYRLKQIDFDGQFEYSKVISINFKGKNGEAGEFYPNPSQSGLVSLDYTSQNDEEITISVFDITGKLIVNHIQQVLSGDNNMNFDFSDLNTGIYIVKIGDIRNPIHRKLIIKR
ncbi:MAG: T9SS type A sorting domain-containing protein [Saprospiraceae bacterium]